MCGNTNINDLCGNTEDSCDSTISICSITKNNIASIDDYFEKIEKDVIN